MKKDKNKIFLFDVNHTLINTALYHTKALSVVESQLIKYTDKESASYITKRFDEIFLLMVAGFLFRTEEEWKSVDGGKESYIKLIDLITKHQKEIKREWGFIKKWSREVFIKIASDEIYVHLNPDEIFEIGTAYWTTITNLTEPFAEGKKLLNYIHKKKYLIYLLTSSDGRLMIKNGFFRYDPKISGDFKKNRMITLLAKGLKFQDIVVGDPEDKPLPSFYERAFKIIEKDTGRKMNLSSLVMVGNSFEDDLEIPVKIMGVGTGVLLEKGGKLKKEGDNIYRTGNLLDIIKLLKI